MSACAQFPENTPLFAKTLKSQGGADREAGARDLLRTTLLKMREKAHFLVSFIPADIPGLTAHDVSHLDALWDMAAKIVGDGYDLTPAEAFVLGGAILLHDAALSVAAYPDGLAGVKATVEWGDIAATLARDGVAEADIEKRALPTVLRLRHAAQAEIIAATPFKLDGADEHLIDDGELRDYYGALIGKIAHSHWLSVSALERELGEEYTPARRLPDDWTVDPVKVACLLRVADAAHLSAERAPRFLMALTKPTGVSATHWTFQRKLGRPQVRGDKLIYSSSAGGFGLSDADAWWQCYESLNMVQDELRAVDILLADTNRPRFQVREVAGVGSPARLKKHIRVNGWEPVDARVTISDVPTLVRTLGGAQLYGDDNSVPLRELMQNACDAIRARRLQQNKDEKWGTITVRLIEDRPEGVWLEVLDDGVGMTERVLTGPLLDFGNSFWRSALANEEFPGLAKKFADAGKEQTGRFGIGFYSVFMLGDHVTVTSRPYRGAESDTKTLDFRTGLSSRPLLRAPADDERMEEPGTRVRVLLHKKPFEEGGLWSKFKQFHHKDGDWFPNPERILAYMAPAIDANLDFISVNGKIKCVEANDWQTMDGGELLKRIAIKKQNYLDLDSNKFCETGEFLRLINGSGSKPTARLSVNVTGRTDTGAVVIDGFRAGVFYLFSGIAFGHPTKVSRDNAHIVFSDEDIAAWASEQARIISNTEYGFKGIELSAIILACGGDISGLPLAEKNELLFDSAETINEIIDKRISYISNRSGKRYDADNDDVKERDFDSDFEINEDIVFTSFDDYGRSFGIPPTQYDSMIVGASKKDLQLGKILYLLDMSGRPYETYSVTKKIGTVGWEKIEREVTVIEMTS